MAKVTKKEEELRQQNMQEAVSKTEDFFKKYGNMMYGCILAILVVALAVLAYNRFILQPKKQQATDQMAQAERWFLAGEYELALNGDDNDPGLLDIIDQYGSKAGEAVYMYAGVAALQTGDFQGAIDQLVAAVEKCREDATWKEFTKNAAYDQREVPAPGEDTAKFCLSEYKDLRDYMNEQETLEKDYDDLK